MRLVQGAHDRLEALAQVGADVHDRQARVVAPRQLPGELRFVGGGRSPATAMLATTADESRPPDRNAATGTSLTRWAATESSSHSTRRSAMSGGAGVSCRGRSQ